MAAFPPGVDAASWRALADVVKATACPPPPPWGTHSRLAAALAQSACSQGALVLAHDHLVMPWRTADGVWHSLPRGAGEPACVKRFLRAPSLQAWLCYEARLTPAASCFYEVLLAGAPVRFWLDLDLPLSATLTRLGGNADGVRSSLACLLETHVLAALSLLFDVRPEEALRVVCVNGDGCVRTQRISLHLIVCGALLPDNEHAAAAVRKLVIQRIVQAARGGASDALDAAALAEAGNLESAIDAVNTRNRLRRLTGHTKIGQQRHSAPLSRDAGLPASAYFVSGAASGGAERILEWRDSAPRPPLALHCDSRPLRPVQQSCGDTASGCPHACLDVDAAVRAELRALQHLGSGAKIVSLRAPTAKFACWTAFTDCGRCPWRAQDSPEAGRAPGPLHRSAKLYVAFFRDCIVVGCTAKRHMQRAAHAYAHVASSAVLFPDTHRAAAACDLPAQMQKMEVSLPQHAARAAGPLPDGKENSCSPFVVENLDAIFTPRFCGGTRARVEHTQ